MDTMDTTLRLNSRGSLGLCSSNLKEIKRKWADESGIEVFGHASLALGPEHSPRSSYSSSPSTSTSCTMLSDKEMEQKSHIDLDLNIQLHIGRKNVMCSADSVDSCSKTMETSTSFDLQLSLSTGPSKSTVTCLTPFSAKYHDSINAQEVNSKRPVPDGHAAEKNNCSVAFEYPVAIDSVQAAQGLTSAIVHTLQCPVTYTSGVSHCQQHNGSTKACQFPECFKGARGASGFCISHGGGRRCQKEGCHKGAEGRTIYCKAHGGGRRCEHLGCTKSAEGRTDFCIAHGGGRRCSHAGCTRASRGKSGFCIRHGGGKRCQKENCTKSAEGYSGLCISHGGGRRCQYPECAKSAQGCTMFCKAHGGGKRCTFSGCTKGAEGSTPFCKGHGGGKRCSYEGGGVCPKSVHGGTMFCVAHGGGKRCVAHECSKSARGRTDFCVRHGGGKRCKWEACGKSAQGSTDFCKAHGGGRRCAWGHAGSGIGAGYPVCDGSARGISGLCFAHSSVPEDNCVHDGEIVYTHTNLDKSCNKSGKIMEIAVENAFSNTKYGDQCPLLWNTSDQSFIPSQSSMGFLPEGRVHGGSLIAMLTSDAGSTSEQQFVSFNTAHKLI